MDTRKPSGTGSAAAHVFGVTELLEKIVMQLPTRNILICQRVCKQFHDTVQGSICIRKLLFLEPSTGSSDLKPTSFRLPSCDQQLSCTDHIHINPLFKGGRLPSPLRHMFISHNSCAKQYYIELWIDYPEQQHFEYGSWRQVYGFNAPLKIQLVRRPGWRCGHELYESMRLGEAVDKYLADSAASKSKWYKDG